MYIKGLEVENFKSFEKLDTHLEDLNLVIGANASGKSNFVQIFKFLKEIENNGLTDAISEEGGVDYLLNANTKYITPLKIKITFDVKEQKSSLPKNNKKREKEMSVSGNKLVYELNIQFVKDDGYKIIKDEVNLTLNVFDHSDKTPTRVDSGTIKVAIANGKMTRTHKLPDYIDTADISPLFLEYTGKIPEDATLLGTPFFNPLRPLSNFFSISIYNFDPKICKNATLFTGKATLQENGANLAIILRDILKDKEKEKKFFNLMKELLPFVNKIDVKTSSDKMLDFRINETYIKDFYLPATLMSDGTIGITALIVALYFQNGSMIILEEPERYLHPYLIFKVMGMIKSMSEKKQIIVTTHSPEVLKHADGLKNLFLISRNDKGYSKVSNPTESESVQTFFKNEIGIDELFAKDLLSTNAI